VSFERAFDPHRALQFQGDIVAPRKWRQISGRLREMIADSVREYAYKMSMIYDFRFKNVPFKC